MSDTVFTGFVKQVISGDSVLIRDRPVDGPPPERVIVLSYISCGRLGRKPSPTIPNGVPEEPYAWAAREFLRKKLVGKEVCYTVENELPSGRSYGCVYIGKNVSGENVALSLVEQGLAEVRKLNNPTVNKAPVYQALTAAEETAKVNGTGQWLNLPGGMRHTVWSIDDPKEFLTKYQGVQIPGIVEYVKDGTSFQITIAPEEAENQLPVFYYISLSLSGIRAPTFKIEDEKSNPEPYALEAQFFVESRLLQRDVSILLQSVDRQRFIGSVLHPNGNIAELLLREGLAKCVEWSLSAIAIPGASEAYRAAERVAKERQVRLWKDYHPPTKHVTATEVEVFDPNRIERGMSFTGQVVEVGNGDNISLRCSDGVVRKFFLASVRFPRPVLKEGEDQMQRSRGRPLYDVPYLFESRETLRAFVGKPVSVDVDYIQPKTATVVDDRPCATVKCGTVNLAQLLVSKGLALVIRYRGASDANRSSAYAELLAAEEEAQSNGLGLHSKADPPVHRVADITGNLAKSRQFIHFLQRTPRMSAIIEFVVHGSRMRAYLPRETCVITLLLSGIQCPRRGRPKPDGTSEPDMPFSNEAYEFTKQICHQRDVEVEIVSMDRVGNFVGYVFVENNINQSAAAPAPEGEQKPVAVNGAVKQKRKKKKAAADANATTTALPTGHPKCNLSVLLVSRGLATVSRTVATEQSVYYHELNRSEEAAKESRIGLWSSDTFVKEWDEGLANANEAAFQNGVDDDKGGLAKNCVAEYLDDVSGMTSEQKQDASSVSTNEKQNGVPALQWKSVQITAMPKPTVDCQSLRFFAQHISDSGAIIKISQLLNSSPPVLLSNFSPRKGELCCACYSLDNCWYRARVLRRTASAVAVQFIDFGNEEIIDATDFQARLAPLPLTGSLANMPPQAHEYRLAFVQVPPDPADRSVAERAFVDCVENKQLRISVIYDSVPCANEPLKPVPAVALSVVPSTAPGGDLGSSSTGSLAPQDVASVLLNEGLVFVEPMQAQLVKSLLTPGLLKACLSAQCVARKERKNIWCYGDFRTDQSLAA